jgi:outer membrane protein TolC
MKRVGFLILLTATALSAEPLDWGRCVELAGTMHPDLISAREDVVSSRADLKSARSDRLPSVDASAKLSKGWTDSGNTKSSSAGLSASQTLLDFGATRSAVKSAGASVDSSLAALKLAQAQVRYNLRVAYLGLWEHQEMLRVLEAISQLRETNLRMVSLRYEGGTENKGS